MPLQQYAGFGEGGVKEGESRSNEELRDGILAPIVDFNISRDSVG